MKLFNKLGVTGRNQIKVLRVRRKGCDKSERKRMRDLELASPAGVPGGWALRALHVRAHLSGGSGGGEGMVQMVLKAPHCLVTGKHRGASRSPRLSLIAQDSKV